MKTVVFFNTNKAWGGGEKWHLNMAISLKANSMKIAIICLEGSELAMKAKENNIDYHTVNISNLSFLNPKKILKVRSLLIKLNPTAIFMNLPRDVKICAPIAKNIGISKVFYRRGMPHPLKNNLINRFVFSFIDTFIANSDEIKKSIIKNLPKLEYKTKVIYNGVIPKDNIIKPFEGKLMLGNIGRLVEQKGHKDLLKVAKILKERNFSFYLYIAGTGPLEEELRKLINSYNLSDHVELLGHIPADELFKKIDFFIFTSHFEGSANALIESLQYQKPVIAFDISSNPEVVENGREGILIKPFDHEKMANAISELSIQPQLQESLRNNAKAKINHKFNYKNKINEIIELINL